jgi:murein tripeptide amidase MpaA
VDSLGSTVQGREIDRIVIGEGLTGRVPVWVIARQHPGETMAEWFVEGFVNRLLEPSDPVARCIRERAVVHVVPNMNPDGAVLGNLRTNAAGRNLNREWLAPDVEASPEVFLVRTEMERTGCALFLDIHGDESLPYVFFSTADDVPDLPPELADVQARFIAAVQAASPDFQTERGYENGRFREDVLKLASKWVAHHFQCLSLTLEMPFKDNANLPDQRAGWNGARSMRLGEAMLPAVLAHLTQG